MSSIHTLIKTVQTEVEENDTIHELLFCKKRIESLLNIINQKIYCLCDHEWTQDYIENPYTECMTKITFCKHCESSKQ